VTIDARAVSNSNLFIPNNPIPAAGQSTLSVDLGGGKDRVNA
jgi:hypothetical protein